jgi:mevalonate kinase
VTLPTELVVEAWWSGQPASTPELIGRVAALAERDAAHHRALLDAQSEAAGASAVAVDRGDVDLLLRSLEAQRQALTALASAAEAAIVTPGAARLGECALAERGVALPAGAGGGDVLLFFGLLPSTSNFRALAAECGHVRLDLCFGARGVHRA